MWVNRLTVIRHRYDTNDTWVGEVACALRVDDVATYPIADDEVLLEYLADGTSVRLIENFDFADIPLTRDGTSAKEIRRIAKITPLRNTWVLAGSPIEENQKTSNKAQEFATSEREKKKKSFEELVPKYLHDYADIFAKDGLDKLPPHRPGVDHRIDTKPGYIPKSSKTYPLSPKETEAVKAFLDDNLAKDFIRPSKSPQASGFFFVGKKGGTSDPARTIGISMNGQFGMP